MKPKKQGNSLKMIVKEGAFMAMSALISPVIGACKLHMMVSDENPFEHYSMFMSLFPGVIGREMRRAYYRNTLKRCGRNLKIGFGSYINNTDTELGENLHTGSYCVIGPCVIGDEVAMASNISILDGLHQHGYSDSDTPILLQPGKSKKVTIGSHTWLGEGARVAASVGEKSIVGIGAVVTREIKDSVMVLGNPARVIGHRDRPMGRQKKPVKKAAPAAAAQKTEEGKESE